MMLPFQQLVTENYQLGLVVAIGIGFFFGFVLERAGFGRATTLAAQFYGTNMTVFKVMFGAIVTAMTGLMIADGVGLIDLTALSEMAASTTYIWPMLIGGLLLGAGFIISGYCPGTSMVSAASGNIDGFVTFSGVIVGTMVYGEIQPAVVGFHNSGDLGQLFLYDLLGVPPAVLAAGVVAMAVGGFFLAEKLEKIFTRKFKGEDLPEAPARPRRYAFATLGTLTVFGLAAMFIPLDTSASAAPNKVERIDQAAFAKRLLDAPWGMRIIDLRAREACAKERIPGAECVPAEALSDLGLQYAPAARDLVLVGAGPIERAPEPAQAFKGRVYLLEDGWAGWQRYALDAPQTPPADASRAQRQAYEFQAALHQAMTGAAPPPPPPAEVKAFVPKKKHKGGGCS